jgi:dipeptidyl-peptidase-4
VSGQDELLTVAERSDFKSTSDYEEVMTFIRQLGKLSPYIRVETIAETVEGRELPLLIIGNPLPRSPESMKKDNRIVIYIQANIHAGEVEGKEASLMFARDLLREKNPEMLRNVVILICPLFNPDGNEQISPANRSYQNGPINGVGVRHNGQFLDLNRDAMKAESPEVRGVIKNVFNKWDPSVFMDCHTTNGSYHVEPVTFTWMVNPNGDRELINYMRDKMVPEMSNTLLSEYNVENCYYGEFIDMTTPEKGWYFDAADTRYMTNYFGIRNRLAILNENYVYADYKSRVMGCYYLIKTLAGYVSVNGSLIKDLLGETDRRTVARGMNPSPADSFAIEYDVRPAPYEVTIKTYEAEQVTDPGGRTRYQKTDRQKTVTIPYFIDYYPTKSVKFPFAWLFNIRDPELIGLLDIHGIRIERLTEPVKVEAQRFDISELRASQRLNQGHYTNTIKGNFVNVPMDFPEGTFVVRASQPLANVAAYLIEPQSNDGLLFWNYLDRYLVPQWGSGYNHYPVFRIINPAELKTKPFSGNN